MANVYTKVDVRKILIVRIPVMFQGRSLYVKTQNVGAVLEALVTVPEKA